MLASKNQQSLDSSKNPSSIPSFEPLESRQLMSASVFDGSVHFRASEKPAVVAESHHAVAKNGSATLPAAANKATAANNLTIITNLPITKFPIIKLPYHFPTFFIEPAVDSNVKSWTSFSSNPLFAAGGPSPNDIKQGNVGDCWFVASLAEVALKDPNLIRNDISQRADGTYDVYFHNGATKVDEHVDGSLPVTSSGALEYAQLGQGGCTWVAIMEKALCYFRNATHGAAYSNTASGWGSESLADLGASNIQEKLGGIFNATQLINTISTALAAGKAVDLGCGSGPGPLVHSHEYSVINTININLPFIHIQMIEVRNPWGTTGPNHDGYEWVTASSIFPEANEVVTATV